MSHGKFALAVVAGATAAAVSVIAATTITAGSAPGTLVGPSSSATPYVVPTAPGWESLSLLTVGDFAAEVYYQMAGIPDGLGAMSGRINDENEVVADKAFMTVLMNHELSPGAGAVRAHGQNGAFVSQWTVHLNSLQVKWGQDLIQDVYVWNPATDGYESAAGTNAAQLNRLCSADLPAHSAFFNRLTGKGFDGRIFTSGEEAGSSGRAFGHVVTGPEKGRSYVLAYAGKFSWENIVAHPNAGDRTYVMGLDDSTPGQLYLYAGTKQTSGNPIERAGLHGGQLFGIRVTAAGGGYGGGAVARENAGAINGTFDLADLSDVATGSGSTLDSTSDARGVTEFARPEDGHWDSLNPNVFYFVTTGATVNGASQNARLYKLTFNNMVNPTGGTIELVVDSSSLTGTDGATAQDFDNMTVDGNGFVFIQEDPGGDPYIAKTWRVNPVTKTAVQVFESDRARFVPGAPMFLTTDEESSGIIDVTDIVSEANWYEKGRRYYLADMQAHYGLPAPLVQGGQLYLLISPKQ
jgi:hypothetical protein